MKLLLDFLHRDHFHVGPDLPPGIAALAVLHLATLVVVGVVAEELALVNRIVEKLVADRQPPLSRLKRPMKIKFARQTGRHPMRITINVGGASDIPESYTRYLRRGIATALHWEHLPIVIEYEKSENPYD